jgi:hypothetical protein
LKTCSKLHQEQFVGFLVELILLVYSFTGGLINRYPLAVILFIVTRFCLFLDESPAPEWNTNAGKNPREQPKSN